MNWHVSGASALSDTGAAPSSWSSLSSRMAAAAAALLRRSRAKRRLFGHAVELLGVAGIQLVDVVPGQALDWLTAGQHLRQLDLQRVHGRDVMDHDADLAPVLGHTSVPLRLSESACQGGKGARSLFEAFGKGLGTLAHGSPLADME